MSDQSLEDAIQGAGGPVELLRDLGVGRFTDLPDAYTHWIEEQLSWQESCALADQSYHMTDLEIEGPDAIDLYSDYAVNSFEGFEEGKAKQMVVANHEGYFIGDAILFYQDDGFLSVGAAAAHNWLLYQAETGDYDVEAEMRGRPVATGDDPKYFRYQVQGPNAIDVMQEATDDPIPELGFFNFTKMSIDGHDVRVLRHGMAGEPGYEFWGDYDEGDAVKRAVREAGRDYGIRRLGSKSYQAANVVLGWLPLPVPAIFSGKEMEDFREWLTPRQGIISIGGSYYSDDIDDYYVTPVELGYDHIINFDHDFVGKEALEEEIENPSRQKVTFVWDEDDVTDVYHSLYEEDHEAYKFMDMPVPRTSACQYDDVLIDGEHVGVSKWISYIYNHREMLSLGLIDTDHAEPGTEVTIKWGEAGGTENRKVARHEPTEISATVAPAPYKEDRR